MSDQHETQVSLMEITAIVTAYRRVEQTLETLRKLQACEPRPAEILVHVDGNQSDTAAAISKVFPDVGVFLSPENLGPGGGRNKLVAAASYPIVASFDDDSYPLDPDYFVRITQTFARYPEASIITGRVFHKGEVIVAERNTASWTADFNGGASVYRRQTFLETCGYVPLTVAYGMEEVDLALRIHSIGGRVLFTNQLRVYHDTNLRRHSDARVTAFSLANIALLVFLRYPVSLWPYGFAQLLNRMQWLLRHGRHAGILRGILIIPMHLWNNKKYRSVISTSSLRSYLSLRRNPEPA